MDRDDAAGGQQEELSPAAAKRSRSAGGSPAESPVPRARWDDSDEIDGVCSLPAGTALMLEDQIPFETAAGTRAHTSGTRAQETEYKSEPQDPVLLLREQVDEPLEATNDNTLGALYGIDPPW
jgi:hypothetical protein